ncbi:prepilin-type N-terminal cleavage/methylation domain-containing protein [Clostridium sp. B9]|uniref:prepilin-type N-terminal cleavage/methylation domain-containing protein n=1 Tax=Clostridium sp. B9 TaxID=3423224 RepID=UPI003D2EF773
MITNKVLKKLKQKKNKKKGFTLIELTVVLAIMALIITVIAPNFSEIKDKSESKVDDQNCSVVERSVEMLLAEGVITETGNFNITITPGDNGVTSAEITGIKAANDLAKLLYDLGKPHTGDSYLAEVVDGKKVNAKVIPEKTPEVNQES